MRILIDRFIELLKWPAAVFMLISLPALIKSFHAFQFMTWKNLALAVGLWMFFLSKSMSDAGVKANIQIIAHEFTHAFFAFLTFHKVTHISIAGDNSGGEMSFKGKGNWLIIIGPYFFPLFCFFCMIGIWVYTWFAPMNIILNGILGYFLGWHIDAVTSQIHEKQTDLPKVGYRFCLMFLPGANLWMLGSVMAFNSRGWEGVFIYQRFINYLNAKNYDIAVNFIFGLL